MRPYPFQNANSSVIAVTTTATALSSLIDTAGAVTHVYRDALDAVDITVEDGDIRMLYDSNTPTASKGILLKRGATYRFRRTPFGQMKLISATGSNVSCSVQIGHADNGESSSISYMPLMLEQGAGEDLANDVQKVEQRFSSNYIATATTTVVKSGVGVLHSITITEAVASTIVVYDNTAASGTIIASFVASAGVGTYLLDVAFSVGLTVVTAGASKLTVAYR